MSEDRWKKSLRDHRTRSKKVAFTDTTKKRRRGVMRTNPTKCHYCKQHFPAGTLTQDHIVPKARGGLDRIWNIVAACLKCNQDKADKWPTCNCDFCRESIRKHAEIGVLPNDHLTERGIRDTR